MLPTVRAFPSLARAASTSAASAGKHKFVVIGAGPGGLASANQIYNTYKANGKTLADGDIAIVDSNKWHDYQPGFTVAGAGLAPRENFRRTLDSLIPKQFEHVHANAASFEPGTNQVVLDNGSKIGYDFLIVAPGLELKWDKVKGLREALADPNRRVSSMYSYDTVGKVWENIQSFQAGQGEAVFTQPFGPLKCAGAPQKISNLADAFWKSQNRDIHVTFATGLPAMFGVPHYAKALNEIRLAKGNIDARFTSNLVEIKDNVATFENVAPSPDKGKKWDIDFGLLHVVPPQGPLDVIKNSPLADADGWVDVNQGTLQSKKFDNVFSLGDASSLPTSKTAAAITSEAPVLVHNLVTLAETGKLGSAIYDGYTSCPLFTGYGELVLAEFKYGGELSETFGSLFNQSKPNRFAYHLTKDAFPRAYFSHLVHGQWYGPRTFFPPQFIE